MDPQHHSSSFEAQPSQEQWFQTKLEVAKNEMDNLSNKLFNSVIQLFASWEKNRCWENREDL